MCWPWEVPAPAVENSSGWAEWVRTRHSGDADSDDELKSVLTGTIASSKLTATPPSVWEPPLTEPSSVETTALDHFDSEKIARVHWDLEVTSSDGKNGAIIQIASMIELPDSDDRVEFNTICKPHKQAAWSQDAIEAHGMKPSDFEKDPLQEWKETEGRKQDIRVGRG